MRKHFPVKAVAMSENEGRRTFLKNSVAAALAAGASGIAGAKALGAREKDAAAAKPVGPRPNIVLYMADQFRMDFVGANGHNGSTRTPNLDALAARGKNFVHTVTNQPVCGPSRATFFSSRYATEAGVWENGLALDRSLPTLAGELRKAGYTSNLIGKWHLAAVDERDENTMGPVRPEDRGGFLDLWEGANTPELVSHPYYGKIWDRDGRPMSYHDQYRVDFLTDRAVRFLRQRQEQPFFLFISQLEPHQQNDMHRPVAPHGYRDRYLNPWVPRDLRHLPGTWQDQLPDYYGCIQAIDESVGRVRQTLEEQGLAENTIFAFVSDHGCHFMTRNTEYKRSAHASSLRVPFIVDGPGFNGSQQIQEVLGLIDVAPTLLDAVGVPIPASWKGRSAFPLIGDAQARSRWSNQQLIQISESLTGRAIHTKDWTYCVADLSGKTDTPAVDVYHEYQLYDERNDPHELVNLAGRMEYRAQAKELREQLLQLLAQAGESAPDIQTAKVYP